MPTFVWVDKDNKIISFQNGNQFPDFVIRNPPLNTARILSFPEFLSSAEEIKEAIQRKYPLPEKKE